MKELLSQFMTDATTMIYFIAIILFLFGLKGMSSPKSARQGILWAGIGMVFATLATFSNAQLGLEHMRLILLAVAIGGLASAYSSKKVKMTAMPQMIALFNGLGGGSAAAISAIELLKLNGASTWNVSTGMALFGAAIGTISFSGSLIAFAKLQTWLKKSLRFKMQAFLNLLFFLSIIGLSIYLVLHASPLLLSLLFGTSLILGMSMTLPIGGADMPVVISLYNALTGLAVAAEGFVLQNPAMIIAGTVVGAAGSLLTRHMARAMNRSLSNILFSHFGETSLSSDQQVGEMKPMEPSDAASMLAYSRKIIIVPGYGMALAQAQHKLVELVRLLHEKNIDVKFAIHPVAGRMPGHMNVLLAEAGVTYDLIYDLEDINADFENTDIAIVIGANDVVNPDARTKTDSPIYGMPILNVDKTKQIFVIKRGRGRGFAGVVNPLFYRDNTHMLFGDAQAVIAKLIQALKTY